MKKKNADLISQITKYMQDNPTIAAWINLVVSIIIAVLIVLILLKIERKITRKWIDKHDGINARFTEKVIRCVIIFLAVLWVLAVSGNRCHCSDRRFRSKARPVRHVLRLHDLHHQAFQHRGPD